MNGFKRLTICARNSPTLPFRCEKVVLGLRTVQSKLSTGSNWLLMSERHLKNLGLNFGPRWS